MKKIFITLLIILIFPVMTFAKNKSTINVAFTIDNNYPIYTLLAINSILLNNYSSSDYHFYIVEDNLTEKNKQKMQKYLAKMTDGKNFNAQMDFINIDTSRADKGLNLFAFSNRITPIAIARIFLPELLDVDRVIYLDGDILVTTDLSELYNTNLGPYVFGMAPAIDENFYSAKVHKFKYGYYNSGMILMNLDKCRKTKLPEKMLTYLHDNIEKFTYKNSKDKSRKFLYPDQDLINLVLERKIKRLSSKWNNQTIDGESMIGSAIDSGSIFHFIGVKKPWDFEKPYSEAERYYMSYWEESPLHLYMYYYMFLKYKTNYQKMVKRKCSRYISFFYHLNNRIKDASTNLIFEYTPEPEVN